VHIKEALWKAHVDDGATVVKIREYLTDFGVDVKNNHITKLSRALGDGNRTQYDLIFDSIPLRTTQI
jgi:hypothetical protein